MARAAMKVQLTIEVSNDVEGDDRMTDSSKRSDEKWGGLRLVAEHPRSNPEEELIWLNSESVAHGGF
jgi:hypothetical protein